MSDAAKLAALGPTRDGTEIGFVRTVDGVPVAIIEAWGEQQTHISRLTNEVAGCHLCAQGICSAHSMAAAHVIQGRLEGVALVWHAMTGDDDDSDRTLHAAVAKYRESAERE